METIIIIVIVDCIALSVVSIYPLENQRAQGLTLTIQKSSNCDYCNVQKVNSIDNLIFHQNNVTQKACKHAVFQLSLSRGSAFVRQGALSVFHDYMVVS